MIKFDLYISFVLEFYDRVDGDLSMGFGGLQGRGHKKQDSPIERELYLSLEEVFHGCTKKMKISRRVRSIKIFLTLNLMVSVWFMVFNTTLNNISVMSWRSVLFVEETGVTGENHRPVASHYMFLTLSSYKNYASCIWNV